MKPNPKIDEETKRYAQERMRERHARIRAWSEAVLQKLEAGYEASAAVLAEDLRRVMEGGQAPD